MAQSRRMLAIKNAREYLAVRPVFLDTETTGLGIGAEIIEISVVDHDGTILFDSLVKPARLIPLDAIQIHGITNEMVRDAHLWKDVWQSLKQILNGRYIGIYNAEFDLKMVRQSHQIYNLPWDFPAGRVFDVMKLYSDYSGSRRWVSLDVAGRQCGISTLTNAHRARQDTLLLRAVFQFIAGQAPY